MCSKSRCLIFSYFLFAVAATAAEPHRHDKPTLKQGDQGTHVEALQRTLNARLKPTPGLSVDGDFGPQTAKAVRRLQTEAKLASTGIVNSETWKALGPFVTAEDLIPSPETINRSKLAKSQPDPLDGVPFVTCRAWHAIDGRTGKSLSGDNSELVLDFASTTKVMTAYLVLNFAKTDASVLDEIVTFSKRADQTKGSTAAVKAGEQLPVRELLYGLMLPSGNDASVALAEHFGHRIAKSQTLDAANADPLTLFVSVMNASAKKLGLKQTSFKNPHGLTAKGHKSTARDLAKLAFFAYQLPHFADYVRTRQRGCTLVGADGKKRNVIWKNTNRLLRTEGYLGIKTGTTTAAGACLISLSEREGRTILLVTLGSAASASRFADARNLHRYLWQQRLATELELR